MGARAVATTTISFGLISVPVKVYIAASSEAFSFNMLTPAGNRVKQLITDSVTGEPVEREDCLKGYPVTKDEFIKFTDEEIDALNGAKGSSIALTTFVPDSGFNPKLVEKSYYLVPDRGADKTLRLLCEAMQAEGKIAIGKFFQRGRDNLVAIQANGNSVMMFQLYYSNELRSNEYTFPAKTEPGDRELTLAKKLVRQLSSEKFNLYEYRDEYAERIRTAIDAKRNGETLTVATLPQANVFDLAALLEQSLASGPASASDATGTPMAIAATTMPAATFSNQEGPTAAPKKRRSNKAV